MARRATPTDADARTTGDLFAHFGVDLRAPSEPPLAAAAPTPAVLCPRCGWHCVAAPCPICGQHRTLRLPPRRR